VGHSAPRATTETMERLEQRTDRELKSTTNTRSLPSTDFKPHIACIWRRQCKGSRCCSIRHCPSRARSHLATRLAKNLTIPRLALVAGHMAMNLVTNVQAALNFLQLETHRWLDSTVALYRIKGQGTIGNSFQTE